MQGLDNTQLLPFAELSGIYTLTNITNDGFSAYRHETHPNQFFFYNISLRALVLGNGLLRAQTSGRRPMTDVQYPYNQVITRWRVYQPSTERLLSKYLFGLLLNVLPSLSRSLCFAWSLSICLSVSNLT